MPALPLQTVRLKHWLDHAVGKIVEVECSSNAVSEHPTRPGLRSNLVKHETERLNDGHHTGIVLILVRLGLVQHKAAPDRTSDVEDRQLVVFPPQTPNFSLPQPCKSCHSDHSANDSRRNLWGIG